MEDNKDALHKMNFWLFHLVPRVSVGWSLLFLTSWVLQILRMSFYRKDEYQGLPKLWVLHGKWNAFIPSLEFRHFLVPVMFTAPESFTSIIYFYIL